MFILDLSGPGRARGRAHGEALRDQVRTHLARWTEALTADIDVDPTGYRDEFLADTDFVTAAEKWTPDILEEARGIAEGAGVDWRWTFLRLLSDEEPWYRRARKVGTWPGRGRVRVRGFDGVPPKGCSSIGVNARPDAPMIVAQNMDTPQWWDGFQTLLRLHDPSTGVRALVFTVAGKISLCGMSDRGLAIACNTLSQLDPNPRGLAEDCIVRGYLAQPTIEAGLQFMRKAPHASGQNYTIAGPDGVVLNLECSARSVVAWRPYQDADRVFHTNHPLANVDTKVEQRDLQAADPALRATLCSLSTEARFQALAQALSNPKIRIDADDIKAALRTPPVCRDGVFENKRDGYTTGSLLMHLGATPFMELSPGPPDRTAYQRIDFQ